MPNTTRIHQRLVPRQTCSEAGDGGVGEGVRASVADPLWFLARQWQLGEFEDTGGGTPVRARIAYVDEIIDEIGWGAPPVFEPIAAPSLPLEAIAESGNRVSSFTAADLPDGPRGGGAPPSAPKGWNADHLEYRFSVRSSRAGEDVVLEVPEHDGDRLDWYSFTATSLQVPPATEPPPPLEAIPTLVKLRGMPNPRWWEFEDVSVDLGNLRRPNLDLLAILLVEYASLYSADWYLIPAPQRTNTVRMIERIDVVDSFGAIDHVEHHAGGGGGFSMYTLGELSARYHFLPNAKHHTLEGEPLESVVFTRDEVANLVWAVERTHVERAASETSGYVRLNRGDNAAVSPPPMPPGPMPRYRASSLVPEHWIPFVPVPLERGQIALRRARTVDRPAEKGYCQYRTQIVAGSKFVAEEEIPETPIEVTQGVEAAAVGLERWKLVGPPGDQKLERVDDKRWFLWLGRKKGLATFADTVTLRFDELE